MWLYKGKTVKSLKDLPKDAFGFTYLLTNLDNGRIYCGKKQLIFSRRKKRSKKARKEKDSRRRFDQIVTESDWFTYNGSCKELLDDIKNGAKIKKEILQVVKSKQLLSYYELKYQFLFEVLEKDSYNGNIAGKFYRKIFNNV